MTSFSSFFIFKGEGMGALGRGEGLVVKKKRRGGWREEWDRNNELACAKVLSKQN